MTLLQRLKDETTADRAIQCERYAKILSRAADPAPTDLRDVRELQVLLGRTLEDLEGDAALAPLVAAEDVTEGQVEQANARVAAASAQRDEVHVEAQRRRDALAVQQEADRAALEAELVPALQAAEQATADARSDRSALYDLRARMTEARDRWRVRLNLPQPAQPAPARPAPQPRRDLDPARQMIVSSLIAQHGSGSTFAVAIERINAELQAADMPVLDTTEEASLRRKVQS